MSKIHLIGGEKGGVGKSVIARLLIQYMIDNNIKFKAFDTDQSHGALLRFYEEYTDKVNIQQFESMDMVIEQAAENPEEHMVVDLAAQTSTFLHKWAEDSGVPELSAEIFAELYYWHVMDSGRDSVHLLEDLLKIYERGLQYIIVLNHVRGEDFAMFNNHPVKERALALGAKIIHIKRLHPPLMEKIDNKSSSFWAAAHGPKGQPGSFSLLERQRVKIWLRNSYAALDELTL